jgi:hypothetical protein
MFIWFVYQDDQGQPWESGLYTQGGARKSSAPNGFAAAARPLDPRNGTYSFRAGTSTPLVTLHARKYCTKDPAGTPIGMTWRIFRSGRLIAVGQQTSALRRDCTITARLRFRSPMVRRQVYTATFEMNDLNGTLLTRRLTLRAT